MLPLGALRFFFYACVIVFFSLRNLHYKIHEKKLKDQNKVGELKEKKEGMKGERKNSNYEKLNGNIRGVLKLVWLFTNHKLF